MTQKHIGSMAEYFLPTEAKTFAERIDEITSQHYQEEHTFLVSNPEAQMPWHVELCGFHTRNFTGGSEWVRPEYGGRSGYLIASDQKSVVEFRSREEQAMWIAQLLGTDARAP